MAMNMAEELWAWVTRYPDGSIGTILAAGMAGLDMTLISRSEKIALAMEPVARAHGRASGQEVWLRRYKMVEDIGREKPN